MSGFLQSLVSSDDACGPVNPLSALSKGLAGDGSQLGRDRFVGIGPSSGNSSFRTNTLQQPEASANAAAQAFFQQQAHHRSQAGSPYNFEAVHGALPRIASPAPGWAKSSKDFAATLQHREGSQRTWEKSRLRDTPGHAAIDQDIPSWAAEFQRDNHAFTSGPMASTSLPVATMDSHRPHFIPSLGTANGLPYTGMQNQLPLMQPGYSESQQQYSYPPPHMHATAETRASEMIRNIDEVSWETAFAKHLEKTGTQLDKAMQTDSVQSHESLTARPTSPSQLQHGHDADLLSKTARELLQSVSHDLTTNTKMRESGFMSLMQKLRDKDVVVEGNQMVAQSGNNQTRPSVSGLMNQALANAAPLAARTPVQSTCLTPLSLHEGTLDAAMRSNQQSSFVESAEDLQAAYDEMNATLDRDVMERQVKAERAFVGDAAMLQEDDANDFALDDALLRNGPAPPTMSQMLEVNPQQQEWATFQDQWERHDAEPATMARPTSTTEKYAFHTRNPYLLDPASTRSFTPDSLLAREADVQRDPLNSRAWLSLGLKQQENEREALAIQALKQAIELEPSMKEAWLALAVSYTNDNLRSKAHDAIDRWVACKPEYSEVLQKYRLHHGSVEEQSTSTSRKHDYLTGLLVDMARAGTGDDHHIDAEVQIALGILFNASEEYEKAADCFSAALSVRPDDPHLYNRLGATYANSGQAADAVAYYHRALELQPEFTRATFNLAIACMSMQEYREAGQYLLEALSTQQNTDADVGTPIESPASGSHTESSILWDTLASCCNTLGRADLAEACEKRNLSPFYAMNGRQSIFLV